MRFYDLVKPFVKECEEYMRSILEEKRRDSYMYDLISEYVFRGGKRLRPVLMFLSAGALGKNPSDFVKSAAIIELFHNFTLIHDDIEDDSLLRRGKPTLHISHGVPVAINTGDALYSLVWLRASLEGFGNDELVALGKCFISIVEGQGMELLWEKSGSVDISEQDYLHMVRKKTADLMSLSCSLPHIHDRSAYSSFSEFGTNLGLAFQIRDDVLNLIGDVEKYKKEIGGDITEGKRTLMVLKAMELSPSSERLKEILLSKTRNQDEIREAISIMKECGAIDYAESVADRYISKAKAFLDSLPKNEYSESLGGLLSYVVKREL